MKQTANPAKTSRNRRNRRSASGALLLFSCFAASQLLVACTNSRLDLTRLRASTSSGNSFTPGTAASPGPETGISGRPGFKISSVSVAAPSGSGSGTGAKTATILFDPTKSTNSETGSIQEACNVTSSGSANNSKPCSCEFSWQEINETSGSSIPIPRVVQTTATNVQQALIQCAAPSVYDSEILDGTTVRIKVLRSGAVASDTGSNDFDVPAFAFTKRSTSVSGAFQDVKGNVFDNIQRYSCYEQFKRGMTIRSKVDKSITNSETGEQARVVLASQFCISKRSGASPDSEGCENMPKPENSAQAYYYNLFIPESRKGDINLENKRYVCPKVREALVPTGTVGGQTQFWPLDQSFSLAVARTQEFQIGVEGFSQIGITSSDSTSIAGSSCAASTSSSTTGSGSSSDGTAGAGGGDSTLVKRCLGFAARPNADGTCPYIRLPTGSIRFTFRLRRFNALYPPIFDTNGEMVSEPQPMDSVYVLDRPVKDSPDDLKPYTMRGPKPCPFSFFDHRGVIGPVSPEYLKGMPSYRATSNVLWNNNNVDGIEYPNTDTNTSCSMALPIYNSSTHVWSVATVNERNPLYKRLPVRPIQSWAPHYEEDTAFEACAPQSTPIVDPPLHFSKDPTNGNINWCAEAYPTQNPNVDKLDQQANLGGTFGGRVIPFTSHSVKNAAGVACTATKPFGLQKLVNDGLYVAAPAGTCPPSFAAPFTEITGVAHHPAAATVDLSSPTIGTIPVPSCAGLGGTPDTSAQTCAFCANKTCDRTVDMDGDSWPRFPLLARPAQTEFAIAADTTYGCTISYDGGNGKTGKTTPSEGCCGANVRLWTGITGNATAAEHLRNTSAHFEPTTSLPCLQPAY